MVWKKLEWGVISGVSRGNSKFKNEDNLFLLTDRTKILDFVEEFQNWQYGENEFSSQPMKKEHMRTFMVQFQGLEIKIFLEHLIEPRLGCHLGIF